MSEVDPRQTELVEWLREQGHSPQEIDKILAKVAEYDARTMHESIFDSINRGDFDVGTIIREALGDDR
jgi:hypothetical protein